MICVVLLYSSIKVYSFEFQIVASSLTCISFLFSICLVLKERYFSLPSVPTRGHGLVLLVFWSMVFINENFSVMNLEKEDWWNHVFRSVRDEIEMALFVTRYVCTLIVFVLGLKAPGLAPNREDDYIHLMNDNNSVILNNFTMICYIFRFLKFSSL